MALMQVNSDQESSAFGLLSAADVEVSLGGAGILDGVAIEAVPGRFHAIIGPSGSGKTTFLRALVGEVGFAGAITLDDKDVSTLSPRELAERRGVLPQSSLLSFPLTVSEVVQLGLMNQKDLRCRKLRRERIAEALSLVDLASYEDRVFQGLSGGEQ
ncbi:MAG: ATP-binding cassette domain-containing protein, partial [Rhodobacteraceae bacterium]|nr:ATP-binding cassette domain-containing protein [Paracoccaceae bacterium]